MATARPSVRRFSVKEYDAMIEHSILTTEDRVELLNGEIINKMPKGPQHSSATDRAARFFIRALSDDFIVRNQIQFGWMKCPNLNRIWL
jgi:hypothetical protein